MGVSESVSVIVSVSEGVSVISGGQQWTAAR
jgi:hypothetical protein